MLTLAHWLARCPLRVLHGLGAALGWLVWLLSPRYRHHLADHTAQAGLTAAQRRASVAEAGRMSLELPRVWLRPPASPLLDPVQWDGAEHIESALSQKQGVLFLTPHLGSFDVAAQAYGDRFGQRQPMTVLYRPAKQGFLRELAERARARPGLRTAPVNLAGVRQLIRALRAGQTVGLLPDQVPPEGQGVWAPFFGRPAYTMTLAARLIQQTGATVLLAWCERLPRGAGYIVHVEPWGLPAQDVGEGSVEADRVQSLTLALNQAMEGLILRRPSQYLWAYHRYKAPRSSA